MCLCGTLGVRDLGHPPDGLGATQDADGTRRLIHVQDVLVPGTSTGMELN